MAIAAVTANTAEELAALGMLFFAKQFPKEILRRARRNRCFAVGNKIPRETKSTGNKKAAIKLRL